LFLNLPLARRPERDAKQRRSANARRAGRALTPTRARGSN